MPLKDAEVNSPLYYVAQYSRMFYSPTMLEFITLTYNVTQCASTHSLTSLNKPVFIQIALWHQP